MKKEYLNEEKYQNINNKIKTKGTKIYNIILCIGIVLVLLGIGTIVINKSNEKNKELEIQKTREEKKQALDDEVKSLKQQLPNIKTNLTNKKQELLNKGLVPSHDYNDGEAYDLYVINEALDPSFPHCHFDDYKKNELTKDYCTLTNLANGDTNEITCDDNEIIKNYCSIRTELYNIKDYDNDNNSAIIGISGATIVFGVMMIIYSLLSRLGLYLLTHRREIMAYQAQQVMPLAQEGIEKMAPTIGGSAGTIGKEIAKGIKEGLKEDESKDAE